MVSTCECTRTTRRPETDWLSTSTRELEGHERYRPQGSTGVNDQRHSTNGTCSMTPSLYAPFLMQRTTKSPPIIFMFVPLRLSPVQCLDVVIATLSPLLLYSYVPLRLPTHSDQTHPLSPPFFSFMAVMLYFVALLFRHLPCCARARIDPRLRFSFGQQSRPLVLLRSSQPTAHRHMLMLYRHLVTCTST